MAERDARYVDGAARPLRLIARDGEDLGVISAVLQDAVVPGSEMAWRRGERRFAVLLNRLRREDPRDPPERARALLLVEDVRAVASDCARPGPDDVLSLLSMAFEPSGAPEDPGGALHLTFAGDCEIRLGVEALEVHLRDVTRPYSAPSGRLPRHGEGEG